MSSPGPGAYHLPTTIGYDKHDNRKQRLPQYSFGTRTGLHDKNFGPGPGAYKVDALTRYGVSRGNEFTIGQRIYTRDTNIGPGPGAHDVHLKPFFTGTNSPIYSISGRTNFNFKTCAPGPNVYKVDVTPTKPGTPAFSIGMLNTLQSTSKSPGPAAYGPGNIAAKLARSPEYSIAPRTKFSYKLCGPGPNMYDLMYYRPGKTGKAYSFGVRHSPFAPPMIVKCDNL